MALCPQDHSDTQPPQLRSGLVSNLHGAREVSLFFALIIAVPSEPVIID